MDSGTLAYRCDPSDTWNFGRNRPTAIPICLLCARPILEFRINGTRPTRREMDDEQEGWKTYDDSAKKHMLVPSAEVEKTIFHKNPRIWNALYRGSEYLPDKPGMSIWLNRLSSGGTESTTLPHRHHSLRWRVGSPKVPAQPAPSTNRESIGLYLYA